MSIYNKLINSKRILNNNNNREFLINLYKQYYTTSTNTTPSSSSSSSSTNTDINTNTNTNKQNKLNSIFERSSNEVIISEESNNFKLNLKKKREENSLIKKKQIEQHQKKQQLKKYDNDEYSEYLKPELVEKAKLLPSTQSPLSDPVKRVMYTVMTEQRSQPILGKGKQHLYDFSTASVDPVLFFQHNKLTIPMAMKFIQRMGLSNHPNRILETVKLLDNHLVKFNIKIYSGVMSGLANCKDVDNCLVMFDRMLSEGITPSTHIFNSLIVAHMSVGKVDESFHILKSMQDQYSLVPDHVNYTSMINGCIKNQKNSMAIQLFSEARIKGMEPDPVTLSVMIDACAKDNRVEKAFQYYEEFKYLNLPPTEVTFNALINACAKRSDDYHYIKAFELLQEMATNNFKPDIITYTSLLNAAAKRGEIPVVEKIYNELLYNRQDFKHEPDEKVFSLALSGYANNQNAEKQTKFKSGLTTNIEKANKILLEMEKRGIALTKYPLDEYLRVHANSGRLNTTATIFNEKYTQCNVKPDKITYAIMIRMYISNKRLEKALELLHKMRQENIDPDYKIYLSLLHGTAKVGYAKTCLKLVNEMNQLGFPPKSEDIKGILKRFEHYPDVVNEIKRVAVFGDDADLNRTLVYNE